MDIPTIECHTEGEIQELIEAVEQRFEKHFHSVDHSLLRDTAITIGPRNVVALLVGFLRDVPEGVYRVGYRCHYCEKPIVEINRNECFVFYKCGCNRNKGVDWDWKTALIGDQEYELGTAGSFVLECPECQNLTFRHRITGELCLFCKKAEVQPRHPGWVDKNAIMGE